MTHRFLFCNVLMFLLTGSASARADDSPPLTGQLTITGRILLPDGSPAAGAIVTAQESQDVTAKTVRTDREGRFQVSGTFAFDCVLHASSADETHHATLHIAALLARTLAMPVELQLARGREYRVSVVAAGKPVEKAQVAVAGVGFTIHQTSSADGVARFLVPADEKLNTLVAWHPERGAAGLRSYPADLPGDTAQLILVPPRLHTVRVLDELGNPVPDLKLGISAGLESKTGNVEWILTDRVPKAHVLTDARGEARLHWFPGESAKYVDVSLIDASWKVDEIENDKVAEGRTTVRVRRTVLVKGRLKMPAGESADGILVSGFGFGPLGRGDSPCTRARADGSFTLAVASDHGYALRIGDAQWASDVWTGMILENDTSMPPPIVLAAYAATPVDIRVTRGPQLDPVAKTWISLRCEQRFSWKDSQGQQRTGVASLHHWLKTDAGGAIETGVGMGEHKVGVNAGTWQETQTIQVQDNKRQTVGFHRPWLKHRSLEGRLLVNEVLHKVSSTMAIRVVARLNPSQSLVIDPLVRPDGTFSLEVDAPDVTTLALDTTERLSAFVRAGPAAESVDLVLSPTATFSGGVVDENDKALPGAILELLVAGTKLLAAESQVSDGQGRFQFGAVAANVPVSLQIRQKSGGGVIHTDAPRLCLPSEARENARIVIRSNDSPAADLERAKGPPDSLKVRVSNVAKDARLNGMHALFVLQGDTSEPVAKLTETILDYDELPAVLGYLPAVIDAKTVALELSRDSKLPWQLPETGEVVLIALDGSAKEIGSTRTKARDLPAAIEMVATFLKQHAPPVRDARKLVASGQDEAKRSDRRVWLVEGGPRCGPCLKLARWMEEHRALLEKDYVVVKILDGNDLSSDFVIERLNAPAGRGIPWMAITEPDGTVLATSDGPLGNIGFPGSLEEVRHLRAMIHRTARQLTSEEQDQLVSSLPARN